MNANKERQKAVETLTEEEYDAIIQKLFDWTRNRQCEICENVLNYTMLKRFQPFNTFDGMIKLQCPKCGFTQLFNPEIAKNLE